VSASTRNLLIAVVLTVGLSALLLSQISISDIVDLFRTAHRGWFLLGILFYVFTYLPRTWRWRILLPRPIPAGPLFAMTAVHNFLVRALPAKLGETSFFLMLRGRLGVSGTEALATFVVARVYDGAVAILLFVLSLFFGRRLPGAVGLNLAAAFLALLVAALFLLRGSLAVRWGRTLFAKVAGRRGMPGFLRSGKLHMRLEALEGHLAKIESGGRAAQAILATLGIWIPTYLMSQCLLLSFGEPFPFWGTVFGNTLATVTSLLPIGTFGNFGTQEAGWTLGFVLQGMGRETAIATGFAIHLVGFTLAGLLALAGVLLGFRTGRGREN
jgi:uncharacterized protein (TIRG00374 family)